MHEHIDELIHTLVEFKGSKIKPRLFIWRGQQYTIDTVTMIHIQQQGHDTVYYFSVTDRSNFFKLAFYTRDLTWKLQELYCE